jgi:hypothetical protein
MNLKKIVNYWIIILLIASAQLFTSCSKENKTPQSNAATSQKKPGYEKIKLSSKEFMQYCDLVITGDSSGVYVQKGDSVLYRHLMSKGYFTDCIVYDRLTGYISYNKCTTIGCEKGWRKYELKVWDFKGEKEWSIKKGKSTYGESLDVPKIINYNEKNNTGIIISYKWESVQPAFYKNGIEQDFERGDDVTTIDAVLPNEEFIVSMMSDDGEAGVRYAKYLANTKEYIFLNETEYLKYNNLALKQFGYNLEVPYIVKLDLSHYNWNPQGTVFVAEHSMRAQASEFWFCNKDLSRIYVFQTDKTTIIPIWK